MSKPISPKQAGTLCRLFQITEANLRQHIQTHEQASPIIGAAKANNAAAVVAAASTADLPSSWTANIEEKLSAYLAGRKPETAPEPKTETPPPPVKAKADPDPARDPEGFRKLVEEHVAQILGIGDMLADKVQARINSALNAIVQTADVTIDAARAEAAKGGGGSALPPLPEPRQGYIRPGWYGLLAAAARGGLDVILSGPAGTGKSRAARELAADLGRESHVFACRAGMTARDLFYSKGLEDGTDTWRLQPLMAAIQTPSVVCLDEAFSIDPECLNGLNGLLESSQRSIDTPLGTITRHPENIIVLTANGGGRGESRIYRAVQAQDASTLSRCVSVETGYEPGVELGIANGHLGTSFGPRAAQIVADLRAALSRAQVAHDVTPRAFGQIAGMMRGGLSFVEAARHVLLAPLTQSERTKVESALSFGE